MQWLSGVAVDIHLLLVVVLVYNSVPAVRMRPCCIAAGLQATAPSCVRKNIGNVNILQDVVVSSSLLLPVSLPRIVADLCMQFISVVVT